MGIYETPYEDFGRLTYEMWRAARLVIDTGVHSKGWTREQALAYLRDHTALSEEAGEPFDDSLTKAEASKRIDALQAKTGRGAS